VKRGSAIRNFSIIGRTELAQISTHRGSIIGIIAAFSGVIMEIASQQTHFVQHRREKKKGMNLRYRVQTEHGKKACMGADGRTQ